MTNKVVKLPQLAKPNIEEVLDDFLREQRVRLRPSTYRKYEDIIDYFKHSMNNYGYQYLNNAEEALFDKYYRAKGEKHKEFCQVFGPEKIPENVDEFLGYFLIRKVICGKSTLKMAGTVMKKLGRWLEKKEYIDKESGEDINGKGAKASRELPAARELTEMLYKYACTNAPTNWEDELDDVFTIERVETGKLYVSGVETEDEIITVPVSPEISSKCKEGWQVTMLLGKTAKGWKIVDMGNVYPL